MEPLVAAVWSCDPAVALDYPARYLFEFLAHHGMLSITGSPQWRTVVGGSREYVARVAAGLDDVRVGTKITSRARDRRRASGSPTATAATTTYDAVVIATHPDQALAMLAEPTAAQRRALSAIPYSDNAALLHTDTSVLPRTRVPGPRGTSSARREPDSDGSGVTVTYDLTRLQRLPTDTHYLVTLGGEDLVDPDAVIERMEYAHPIYTPESIAAQRALPEANTARIAFAGAYHGWGFHEDGARSGAAAAAHLGLPWDAPALPRARACSPSRIRHTRRRPFRKDLRAPRPHVAGRPRRACPTTACSARFEARDHLGSPRAHAARERRRVPRRARRRPDRWPRADGGERPRVRLLLQPDQRLLVLRPHPASSPARSSRCTTPTAAGTPTSSTPTSVAARGSTRSCTSRRSTAPTAGTTCACRYLATTCWWPSRCTPTTARCSARRWTDAVPSRHRDGPRRPHSEAPP